MEEKILQLKKLRAAYITSLEYDICPGSEKAGDAVELFDMGISAEEFCEALDDQQGSRPYEIADRISDLIKEL